MPPYMLHAVYITLVYLEFLQLSLSMRLGRTICKCLTLERILGLAVKPSVRAVACREYSPALTWQG